MVENESGKSKRANSAEKQKEQVRKIGQYRNKSVLEQLNVYEKVSVWESEWAHKHNKICFCAGGFKCFHASVCASIYVCENI